MNSESETGSQPRSEDRLFGQIAQARGYATPSQVLQALDLQVQWRREGKPTALLGSVLVALNVMTADQVMEVLKEQDPDTKPGDTSRVQALGDLFDWTNGEGEGTVKQP